MSKAVTVCAYLWGDMDIDLRWIIKCTIYAVIAFALLIFAAAWALGGTDDTPTRQPMPTPAPVPTVQQERYTDTAATERLLAAYISAARLRTQRRHATHHLVLHVRLVLHSGDPSASDLKRLRWCESGRDNSAGVSSDEAARGYYKFMRGTWRGVGGTGDPAAATLSEQTYRAILLYRKEGWRPWLASASCTGLY